MNIRNLSGTTDYLAEMCVTDINGQCVVSADVSTSTYISNTTYRFILVYNNRTVGNSGYTTISTTANAACNSGLPCVQLKATIGTNPLNTFFAMPGVQYTRVNYTPTTKIFRFSVVDVNGVVQQICLRTTIRTGTTYAVTNSSCVTSAASSMSLFSNTSLGEETIAQGYVVVGGREVILSTRSVNSLDSGGVGNVLFFLFFGLLFLGTVFFSYKANASLAMLMTGGMAVVLFYISAFPLITNAFIVSGALIFILVVARSKE